MSSLKKKKEVGSQLQSPCKLNCKWVFILLETKLKYQGVCFLTRMSLSLRMSATELPHKAVNLVWIALAAKTNPN